jgi:hypothetical protein
VPSSLFHQIEAVASNVRTKSHVVTYRHHGRGVSCRQSIDVAPELDPKTVSSDAF